MEINWIPLLTFMTVASFTPGPNNLNAAAIGMSGGCKKAVPFILGVYTGVSILLSLTGFLKMSVDAFLQKYQLFFKIACSAYLLWIAWNLVRDKGDLKNSTIQGTYTKGLILQIVNPKALLFSITIFTLFFDGTYTWNQILLISFTVTLITIAAISTWAAAGAVLSRFLQKPVQRRIFYRVCAALLLYTVLSLFIT